MTMRDMARPTSATPRGSERRFARPLRIERVWAPSREAMAAALRVVLGLPRVVPQRGDEVQ